QPLVKRCEASQRFGIVRREVHEHANAPHALARLPARRKRPRGCRPAEQRDELTTSHSITSSARARKVGDILSPSTLAVVRLTTRSNLVGCSTGMSPGFVPRRILSKKSPARR